MKALYIGIYSNGTTSKMRADMLGRLLGDKYDYKVIDTDIPFFKASRLWRSVAFRFKTGPLTARINRFVKNNAREAQYELIWVDKSIYLWPRTTRYLKSIAKRLVHYTPDAQFYANRSRHFFGSMRSYDFLVTTKSFEKKEYEQRVGKEKLILTTQGFDSNVHRPMNSFEEKKDRVAFIGLCEPHREAVMQYLLDNQVPVIIGGMGWNAFREANRSSNFLEFAGEDVRNDEYSRVISGSYFSIGLLSRHFPELHTTRTFEIPACGTALLTERNNETTSFFSDNEAIFYNDMSELVEKIQYHRVRRNELKQISENGLRKVNAAQFHYEGIMQRALDRIFS